MKRYVAIPSLLAAAIIWAIPSVAQQKDTTQTNLQAHERHLKQPETTLKSSPMNYYIPYYYYPMPVEVSLGSYSLIKSKTASMIEKSRTTDAAMQSIQYTIMNDKRMAEQYKIMSYIGVAGALGAMTYQIVNGERLAKREMQRREARSAPPVRR